MPTSLQHLPNEVLLHVLSFIPAHNARQNLSNLSLCSRRLHDVATPSLYTLIYTSIAVEEENEMMLLLRILMRNSCLRRYIQSFTLAVPDPENLFSGREAYFTDDADVELLRTTIEETLQDDAWHQPPPKEWCSRGSNVHAQEFGADASPRWFAAANRRGNWNAPSALLLALMPGLTHLEVRTAAARSLQFDSWYPSRYEPTCDGPECMTLVMLAAANTQLRALAAAADPARAPQDAADGVLPRLRSVSCTGQPNMMEFMEMMPLALPPLVEELRVEDCIMIEYAWHCDRCDTEMKLNVKSLTIGYGRFTIMMFRNLVNCFPKLEKLVGCLASTSNDFDDEDEPTTREALESVAGTLKELDMSENSWPYKYDESLPYMPTGPLCDFPVLERLSISAERQLDNYRVKQQVSVPERQMLLGQFPASLKELTVTGKTHAPVLAIVEAINHLLDTHEVPALQLITVGLGEMNRQRESVVNLRRHCEARGIGLILPLVNRFEDSVEYQASNPDYD